MNMLRHRESSRRCRTRAWIVKSAVVLVAANIVACAPEKSGEDRRSVPLERVPGSFIVGMNSQESGPELEASKQSLLTLATPLAEQYACTLAEPEAIAWDEESGSLSTDLMHTFHIEFNDCQLGEEQISELQAALLAHDQIESVEANAVVRVSVNENDPYKSRQYYLDQIGRDEACDLVKNRSGKPVVVAVVDSGVDSDHPDLVQRFFRDAAGNVIGANFVGKGSRGNPDRNWDDTNGHGTHVAGIVSAAANNGLGVAGVASCANVLIMPVRVMGPNGTGNSLEIDRGIQWAAARGADIINLSLGSNSLSYSKRSSHPKSLYANLERQGVIVFAAAGNEGLRNGSSYQGRGYVYSYPASYDGVIAVASTEQRNRLSSFSNRGEQIDIAAPGSSILSTIPGGRYNYQSGTSMATPVAVGAYALALSAVRNSGRERLDHDALMSMLMNAVDKRVGFGTADVRSGGLISVPALVTSLMQRFPEPQQPDEEPTTPPTQPQPNEPQPPQPEQPEEPAKPEGMQFVNLTEGQTLSGAVRIALAGWPEGTYRIYLYWLSGNEWFPSSFTSVGRENLLSDGQTVATNDYYYLYGNKSLMAVAVNGYGQTIQVSTVRLRGLSR